MALNEVMGMLREAVNKTALDVLREAVQAKAEQVSNQPILINNVGSMEARALLVKLQDVLEYFDRMVKIGEYYHSVGFDVMPMTPLQFELSGDRRQHAHGKYDNGALLSMNSLQRLVRTLEPMGVGGVVHRHMAVNPMRYPPSKDLLFFPEVGDYINRDGILEYRTNHGYIKRLIDDLLYTHVKMKGE